MTISSPVSRREMEIRPDDAYGILGLATDLSGPVVSFKLCVVPEKVRMRAADVLCRQLAKIGGLDALDMAVDVKRRAMFPSDRTYRVSRAAWERVMNK